MRRQRSTKIVATLGPASSSPAQIEALFEAGVDVFRLNFSHGSHDDHRQRVAAIRAIERRTGRPIGILMDLQGPKLRLGRIDGGAAQVATGAVLRLDLDPTLGNAERVPLPHPEIFAALHPGAELLIDDGKVRLKVLANDAGSARCEVMTGGTLSNHKGVNLPGVVLAISPFTEKDHRDLAAGLDMGCDWVGLSFVQRPEDIAEARRLIAGRAAILAKIEKPAAVETLDAIVDLADGVMAARGDLGVEMPPEDVPSVQKHMLKVCRRAGKPVIVATQMLDSMVHAPTPTRAEASDVATAVYDGADAVMLSAETASGDYPIEAVTIMDRIIARVERDPLYRRLMDSEHAAPEHTASDAITAAARQVAHTIAAAAIVTFTSSGSTTLRAARERPDVPILCLTESERTARRLSLCWGVYPVVAPDIKDFGDMVERATTIAERERLANRGDRLVITAGVPFGTSGSTNVLRISRVAK